MFAMRLARVHTGRTALARVEGGYHGTHDMAEVSAHPDLALAGPAHDPVPVADSPGTPPWALEQTVVLPFNDADAAEAILRREGARLAGVIVAPNSREGASAWPRPSSHIGARGSRGRASPKPRPYRPPQKHRLAINGTPKGGTGLVG